MASSGVTPRGEQPGARSTGTGHGSAADSRFPSGHPGTAILPENPVSVERLSELLVRTVRYTAEQQRLVESLRRMALTDELTGLHSRRGFLLLARQQMKLARRMKRGVLLAFCDLDGLKQINDSCGHREGDLALQKVARALRKTFRDSDVIGRMGGDEFTIFALEASDYRELSIAARLRENLHKINAGETRYTLSLSMGVARSTLKHMTSIESLLIRADEALYDQKHKKSELVSTA